MLTGLANRHSLVREVQEGIVIWRSKASSAAIACLNIDKFKRLNEVLGHRTADLTLIAITHALQQCLRRGDILARVGGDEFVLLVNDTCTEGQAQQLFLRLMGAVSRQIDAGQDELSVP